jgi:Intracellular proteinase inhibitor
MPRLLTVLGLLTICMGSTSSSCTSLFRTGSDDSDDPSFVAQLQLQDANGDVTDTFERGETIVFVLTVRNRLDTSASAEFTTTRTSDFVVLRENTADVVWQWSDGRAFSDVATTIEFAPGETRTFTETWNQILSNGTQLRSGNYEARGVLVFSGFDSDPLRENQMGSTPEPFTIQ